MNWSVTSNWLGCFTFFLQGNKESQVQDWTVNIWKERRLTTGDDEISITVIITVFDYTQRDMPKVAGPLLIGECVNKIKKRLDLKYENYYSVWSPPVPCPHAIYLRKEFTENLKGSSWGMRHIVYARKSGLLFYVALARIALEILQEPLITDLRCQSTHKKSTDFQFWLQKAFRLSNHLTPTWRMKHQNCLTAHFKQSSRANTTMTVINVCIYFWWDFLKPGI